MVAQPDLAGGKGHISVTKVKFKNREDSLLHAPHVAVSATIRTAVTNAFHVLQHVAGAGQEHKRENNATLPGF